MGNNESVKLADQLQCNRWDRDMSFNDSRTVPDVQRSNIPTSGARMITLSAYKYNKLKTNLNYAHPISVERLEKLRTTKEQNRELEEESKKLLVGVQGGSVSLRSYMSSFRPASSTQKPKQIAPTQTVYMKSCQTAIPQKVFFVSSKLSLTASPQLPINLRLRFVVLDSSWSLM